jgi:enterochelin esterase-like enzyme/sugar lactone lactonase YvrE
LVALFNIHHPVAEMVQTMPRTIMPVEFHARRLLCFLAVLFVGLVTGRCFAQDWGAYRLIPASARSLVLEAVDSGTTDGTPVSLGKPATTPNQKWFMVPKGDGFFSIRPAYSSTLVLAVAQGSDKGGAAIVLETDKGEAWQQWSIKKNDFGTYGLLPKHAPDKGLDNNAGKQIPGAKQDLWTYKPNDAHLQWLIVPLAGSPVPPAPVAAVYEAPSIKPEDVLQGTIKQTSFSASKIFPGTVRDVAVFIPAQYDGSKPACVYVKTDGYNPREKTLLETLIATKEMPVTIGVFVRPGNLPAPMKNALGRRNRCFEYDGMGDNNVRFFIEEILPFVAKEFDLKLSASGNDRCIAGGSSGGITAFNAAWERPDAFSRVYANSGSFVAFRGGHEFPTLIRKFEAKPIRAYLTTGTHDMENCAGDWFLLDQEMDKALRFSGYDYFFRIIEGGHVAGYYDFYQEAMAFIWKDWPKPVQAGTSAPRARDVILPDETWQPVAQNGQNLRGPACNAAGEVFYVDAAANKICRIDLDGNVKEFLPDAGQANSLSFGAEGQLYTVSSKTGKVMSYDPSGKGTLVADGLPGEYVLAMPGGGLYVTSNGDQPEKSGQVWWVKDGKKTLVDSGLKCATGLAYRPDQWLLSVADGHSKWAYSYQINADGTLINKERFFWLHVADGDDDAGAQSVCYALEGQMCVATRFGIQICADDGPTQVILPLPDRSRAMGVSLGGRNQDTLFAFSGDKIWKRKVKVHAMGAFSPWTKVNGAHL